MYCFSVNYQSGVQSPAERHKNFKATLFTAQLSILYIQLDASSSTNLKQELVFLLHLSEYNIELLNKVLETKFMLANKF